jgi:hypothetical protein
MKLNFTPRPVLLLLIFLVAYINSAIFVILNGQHHQIAMQISLGGLVVNVLSSVTAWIVFVKGKSGSMLNSILASLLLVGIHYLLFSNIITLIY